jgi:hypothetical protein
MQGMGMRLVLVVGRPRPDEGVRERDQDLVGMDHMEELERRWRMRVKLARRVWRIWRRREEMVG